LEEEDQQVHRDLKVKKVTLEVLDHLEVLDQEDHLEMLDQVDHLV